MRAWLERGGAIAFIALGLAVAAWLHGSGRLEWSVESLRALVLDLGWLGPAVLISMMAMRPFLALPSALVLFAAGLLFGPVLGTLYGALGGLLGAWIAFWLARVLGRETVHARVGDARLVRRFDHYLTTHGAPWLGAWTALPVTPLTPLFFSAGLTHMSALGFGAAIGAGFLPRAGVYAFWGQAFGEPTRANLVVASLLLLLSGAAIFLARGMLRTRHSQPPR